MQGAPGKQVTWVPNRPERLEFPVQVSQPVYAPDGTLSNREVLFRVGVDRKTDGAADAFEIKLPVRDDRRRVTVRSLTDLVPGKPAALPEVKGEARPGHRAPPSAGLGRARPGAHGGRLELPDGIPLRLH